MRMEGIVKSFYASAKVSLGKQWQLCIWDWNFEQVINHFKRIGVWDLEMKLQRPIYPVFKLGKIGKLFYLRGKGFLNFIYSVTEFREPFLMRGFIWKSYSYTEFANWQNVGCFKNNLGSCSRYYFEFRITFIIDPLPPPVVSCNTFDIISNWLGSVGLSSPLWRTIWLILILLSLHFHKQLSL